VRREQPPRHGVGLLDERGATVCIVALSPPDHRRPELAAAGPLTRAAAGEEVAADPDLDEVVDQRLGRVHGLVPHHPPDGADGVAIEHRRRQAHRLRPVDEAEGEHRVRPGHRAGEAQLHGLAAGLVVADLGVARAGAAQHRQLVEAAHLDADDVDEPALGRPRQIESGAHVGDAGADSRDQAAARPGELEEDDRREHLGQHDDRRAEHGDRGGRPGERHGQDEDRHTSVRQRERRLGHLALVLERSHGAVDRREDGALAEGGAGDSLQDLEQWTDVGRIPDLVLDVLRAGGQRDRLDLEGGREGAQVASRDRGPGVVDLGQGVEELHDGAQRRRGTLAAHTADVVEQVGARPVGAEGQRAVADHHVVRRVAGRKQDLPGTGRKAALDELPRQLRRQQLAVDGRPGVGEQLDGLRCVVRDADVPEDAHDLLVDVLAVGRGQIRDPRAGHAARRLLRPARRMRGEDRLDLALGVVAQGRDLMSREQLVRVCDGAFDERP